MTKFGLGFGSGKNKAPSFYDIINLAGAASSLATCCDPGVLASYAGGSASELVDLSGNGNGWVNTSMDINFNVASTPALSEKFSGTAGNATEDEYLISVSPQTNSSQAGHPWLWPKQNDCRPDSGRFGSTTYGNSFHGLNSGFTIAGLFYCSDANSNYNFFGTAFPTTGWGKGLVFMRGGPPTQWTGAPGTRVVGLGAFSNASGGFAYRINSSLSMLDDQWSFVAVSMDSTGNVRFRVNGTPQFVSSPGLSSPNTSGIRFQFPFYWWGVNNTISDARQGPLAVWNRALSDTELSSIYSKTKQYRYPSLT